MMSGVKKRAISVDLPVIKSSGWRTAGYSILNLKLLSLKREVLGQRKEMDLLENKLESHHGCLDLRTLPKKRIFL